jgi:hypothetical protein
MRSRERATDLQPDCENAPNHDPTGWTDQQAELARLSWIGEGVMIGADRDPRGMPIFDRKISRMISMRPGVEVGSVSH